MKLFYQKPFLELRQLLLDYNEELFNRIPGYTPLPQVAAYLQEAYPKGPFKDYDAVQHGVEYLKSYHGVTVRILNKHTCSLEDAQNAVNCMRPGPYQNPFRIGERDLLGKPNDRDRVCELFDEYVLPGLNVEPLRGKDLLCCCFPKRCHTLSIYKKLYGRDYDETLVEKASPRGQTPDPGLSDERGS